MDLFASLGLSGGEAEESAVTYALYLGYDPASSAVQEGTHGSDALLAFKASCMQLLLPFVTDYIWQKDRFELRLSTEEAPPWTTCKRRKGVAGPPPEPPCLWGTVRFGDNIEDEWFIVWLLLELTRLRTDISAKVFDNDGEFLLIEAAYSLPRWLKPESARNRVWLRGGALHIVPPPSASQPELPSSPSVTQALQVLSSDRYCTRSPKVQEPITARLAGYPAAARQNMHRACCRVPARVAHVMQAEPQLVAGAVEAFHHRDVADMRTASHMRRFPPEDMAVTVVTMNRCQYAQLAQQRFEPPRGYPSVPPNHPSHKAADLGLKLTAGFEILYARSRGARQAEDSARPARPAAPIPATCSTATAVDGLKTSESHASDRAVAEGPSCAASAAMREERATGTRQARAPLGATLPPVAAAAATSAAALGQQLAGNPAWLAYCSSLHRLGYFQGNIAGSARYQTLLSKAAGDFAASAEYAAAAERLGRPAQRIDEVLANTSAGSLPVVAEGEDDDSWLESQARTLEEELARRQAEANLHSTPAPATAATGQGTSSHAATKTTTHEVDAAELAAPLRGFVEYLSAGVDGAEVPRGERDVAFDAGSFLAELERVLGGVSGTGHGAKLNRAKEEEEEAGSSSEGSSFFSTDEDEVDDADSDDGDYDCCTHSTGKHQHDEGAATATNNTTSHGVQPSSTPQVITQLSGDYAVPRPTTLPDAATQDVPRAPQPTVTAMRAKAQVLRWPKHANSGIQEGWEVCTATDSDDDGHSDMDSTTTDECDEQDVGGMSDEGHDVEGDDDGFMAAYAQALEQQLRGTKMAETFEREALPSSSAADTGSGAAGGGVSMPMMAGTVSASGQDREAPGLAPDSELGDADAELRPIDLDMNLVKNLIRSYTSQQGLPGPAGSLAGLMGLKLPRGEVE